MISVDVESNNNNIKSNNNIILMQIPEQYESQDSITTLILS